MLIRVEPKMADPSIGDGRGEGGEKSLYFDFRNGPNTYEPVRDDLLKCPGIGRLAACS